MKKTAIFGLPRFEAKPCRKLAWGRGAFPRGLRLVLTTCSEGQRVQAEEHEVRRTGELEARKAGLDAVSSAATPALAATAQTL